MPAADLSEAPDRTASLRTLIAAAGCELLALAREGHRLQALIGAHVAAAGSNERAVEDAQMLDVLLQHHEALAEVLTKLAAEIPSTAEVDLEPVLGSLRLSGLADRLAGTRGAFSESPGELEVF